MQIVGLDGITYACSFSPKNINITEKRSYWLGKQTDNLQGSLMCYNKKDFAIHKHRLNPRLINHSQEAFIVLQGVVEIDIYEDYADENGDKHFGYTVKEDVNGNQYIYLGTLTAREKDIIIVWKGYHAVKFTADNTLAYELKAGSFGGVVSEDKIIIKLKEDTLSEKSKN
jgi:hypothetical protein